jgi:hypothetical protein
MWQAEGVTVELPDSVVRRAEEEAKELGIPLSEYLEQALEEKHRAKLTAEKPWMAGFGELRHLHDDFRMIEREVEEAFEQIEPED